MAYNITSTSKFLYVVDQLSNGQRVINTFWYTMYVDPSAPPIDGVTFFNTFLTDREAAGGLISHYQGILTTLDTITSHWCQLVQPVRYRKVVHLLGLPGTAEPATGRLPQSNAISITRAPEMARRGGTGRIQLLCTDGDLVDSGLVQVPLNPHLVAIRNFCEDTQVPAAFPLTQAIPIIYNRANPAASLAVSTAFVELTARVMQRRVVGRGE